MGGLLSTESNTLQTQTVRFNGRRPSRRTRNAQRPPAPPAQRQGNVRRVHRRHKLSRRAALLMPPKPHQPPTGFNLYIRWFYSPSRTRPRTFETAPELMDYAAQEWRSDASVRRLYKNRARPAWIIYRRARAQYKALEKLLKHPGNAFICFSNDLWQREGNGQGISSMARLASMRWNEMELEDKLPFFYQSLRAKEAYENMLTEVSAGRARLEDYLPRPQINRPAAQSLNQATAQGHSLGQAVGSADGEEEAQVADSNLN